MKKTAIVLLVFFGVFCFAGCGNNSGKGKEAEVKPPAASTNIKKKDAAQKGVMHRFECKNCNKVVETTAAWPPSGRCMRRSTSKIKKTHRWKRLD